MSPITEPFERHAWERMKRESPVIENSLWKHKSGVIYRVITVANVEATRPDYPVTVVYEDAHAQTWARPITTWYESFVISRPGIRSNK